MDFVNEVYAVNEYYSDMVQTLYLSNNVSPFFKQISTKSIMLNWMAIFENSYTPFIQTTYIL